MPQIKNLSGQWTCKQCSCVLKLRQAPCTTRPNFRSITLPSTTLKPRRGIVIWTETEGSLSSEVFAYLQHSHFDKVIAANPEIEELVIWSDGCGYQNRNVTTANAYSHLSQKHGVNILQKYLVAGHTQMECDSMHSTIERKMVNDIFTPRDYVVIMECARIRPSPYHVKEVSHSEMHKLNGSYFTSIRPGKKAGDPTVHDLRGLEYQSNGHVRYRLSFSEDSSWEMLPQRINTPNELDWIRIFQAPQPITLRKFNDLQSMKNVMPAACHAFIDNLPYA